MIDRMDTMPARDIAHGSGSREANVLTSKDIVWLAESIGGRGGNTPSVDAHVMRASDLLGIFSDYGAFNYDWVKNTYSATTVYLDGKHAWEYEPSWLGAPEVEDLAQPSSDVRPGGPMRGSDIRRAFYNACTHDLALCGRGGDWTDEENITFDPVDNVPFGGRGKGVLLMRQRRSTQQKSFEGVRVTGGRCIAYLSGLPMNADKWKIEAVIAAIGGSGKTAPGELYTKGALAVVDGSFIKGTIQLAIQATDLVQAAEDMLNHFGISMTGEDAEYHAVFYGAMLLMRAPENYMLSDLGWSFKP